MTSKLQSDCETANAEGENRLVDLTELVAFLKISKRSVWRLVARGELTPPVKVGRNARWFLADLHTYLDRIRQQRDSRCAIVANRRGVS
jgi:predicted DNA-binding transcriptional regulator AlpA